MLDMDALEKQAFRALIDAAGELEPRRDDDSLGKLLDAFVELHRNGFAEPVASRMAMLRRIFAMADDDGWALPSLDKHRIGGTFRYLLRSAGNGEAPLDTVRLQATAIDLMARDCGPELELYEEFCVARDGNDGEPSTPISTRADWLRHKREQLNEQSKRRIFGMRRSRSGGRSGRSNP